MTKLSRRYDCQGVWDGLNKNQWRTELRKGSSKKADFFKYKDWHFAHLKANKDVISSHFVFNPDMVIEFQKLSNLFSGNYAENDLAWDKAREIVDKIMDFFYSLDLEDAVK